MPSTPDSGSTDTAQEPPPQEPLPVPAPIIAAKRSPLGASSAVALGVLLSRIIGLVRERVFGHYFGVESIHADAFRAAIRIPNLLSNLFGEGVLSASFVTVYAKLRAQGKNEEAEHLAESIFSILALVCAVLVLFGVLATPLFVDAIVPFFQGSKRIVTIRLVRILFPSAGLLVMSAWCLGVLNSHRQFLLSYLAPVALSLAVIVVTISTGQTASGSRLVAFVAWGWVLGALLQFLVQLPRVLSVLPGFRPRLQFSSPNVRTVLKNFGPVVISRGVVQLSAYIDQMIASALPTSAVAALGYGQVIAILPISLFSMSVSAAELPTLASATGTTEEIAAFLRKRLAAGLRRIAFFVVPSAVAFLLLGDIVIAFIYQSGKFQRTGVEYVWGVLAGSAVGLLATSLGRLYSSAFYALLDTKTPLRFALIRVTLTAVLGVVCAIPLPHWLGIDAKWGIAGLTVSAGIAGWVEFTLLRHSLGKRIGKTPLSASFTIGLWSIAISAAAVAYFVKLGVGTAHPIFLACLALPIYGAIYFAGTAWLGIPESRDAISGVTRRLGLKLF